MITEDFIEYLRDVKKMSQNTIEAYRRDIDAYSRFLDKRDKTLEKATNTDVVAYLMDLKSGGKSKSTVNRKLASPDLLRRLPGGVFVFRAGQDRAAQRTKQLVVHSISLRQFS